MNLSLTENELTMSSVDLLRVINEYRLQDGKNEIRHDNFMAKVADELESAALKFKGGYSDTQGQQRPCYHLPEDECFQMAMRESKFVRKATVKKIRTMAENAAPSIPQTFGQALQLAADQAKQLELAAPKIAFVDKYVESTGSKTFREVCKIIGAKENAFREFLAETNVMYKLSGSWVPYQNHIDAGRFEVKTGEKHDYAFTQSRFTPKGFEYIAGKWAAHCQLTSEGVK